MSNPLLNWKVTLHCIYLTPQIKIIWNPSYIFSAAKAHYSKSSSLLYSKTKQSMHDFSL